MTEGRKKHQVQICQNCGKKLRMPNAKMCGRCWKDYQVRKNKWQPIIGILQRG